MYVDLLSATERKAEGRRQAVKGHRVSGRDLQHLVE